MAAAKKKSPAIGALGKRVSDALQAAVDAGHVKNAAEVARLTGVLPGYISGLINGHRGDNASAAIIGRLATALRCDVQWLATGEGTMARKDPTPGLTEEAVKQVVAAELDRRAAPPPQQTRTQWWDPDPRYPNLAKVIARLDAAGDTRTSASRRLREFYPTSAHSFEGARNVSICKRFYLEP